MVGCFNVENEQTILPEIDTRFPGKGETYIKVKMLWNTLISQAISLIEMWKTHIKKQNSTNIIKHLTEQNKNIDIYTHIYVKISLN